MSLGRLGPNGMEGKHCDMSDAGEFSKEANSVEKGEVREQSSRIEEGKRSTLTDNRKSFDLYSQTEKEELKNRIKELHNREDIY